MLIAECKNKSIVNAEFERREILVAFHDVDGTHSLIREWPPVMSGVLYDVIVNGLPENYDSEENVKRLVAFCGTEVLEETDRFCVESAGLSALTQMEWAIRRSMQEGNIVVEGGKGAANDEKIARIWKGEEIFEDLPDTPEVEKYLTEHTPRLFKLYENVLNGFCRDKNLEKAKKDPASFQINGSMEWIKFLKDNGVKNYFVTGAVVEKGMGMYEEVEVLGYTFGEDGLMDDIYGSTWDEKVPKNVIMERLVKKFGLDPKNVLIVGDGRSEIATGVNLGALTISRLPMDATVQRELHKNLGTNIIVEDYECDALYENLHAE